MQDNKFPLVVHIDCNTSEQREEIVKSMQQLFPAATLSTVPVASPLLQGKTAGPIRNAQMANYADCLIAFPDANSVGTRDMIKKAKAKNLMNFTIECY